jgi:hypothetical protein
LDPVKALAADAIGCGGRFGSETRRGGVMGAIQVEVARTIDLDRLVETLGERGFEPRVLHEDGRLGVEVLCGEEPDACHELYHELETWIADQGLPLVPIELESSIVLRPPLS